MDKDNVISLEEARAKKKEKEKDKKSEVPGYDFTTERHNARLRKKRQEEGRKSGNKRTFHSYGLRPRRKPPSGGGSGDPSAPSA